MTNQATPHDLDDAPDEQRCPGCGQYPTARGCACDDDDEREEAEENV